MASKQLSIIIKAVDQATQPLRAAATAAAAVGTRISAGLAGIRSRVMALGSSLFNVRNLIAAAGAAFAAWRTMKSLGDAADEVDRIGKAAARLGMSVEEMSALRYMASQAGVEFEELAKGVAKVQKNAAEFARNGGGSAAEAFRRLGVPITDAAGKVRNINQLLPELMRAIQGVGGEAEQINLTEAIFGRGSGEGFLNILKESPRLFEDLALKTEQARRLGVEFTDSQWQKTKEYGDAVDRVGQAWLGLRVRVLEKIAPTLVTIYDRLSSVIAAVPEMVGNLTTSISKALEDSAEGQGARAKFRQLATDLQDLITTALGGAAFIGFELFGRLGRVAMDELGVEASNAGSRAIRNFFAGAAQEAAKFSAGALTGAMGMSGLSASLAAQIDASFEGVRMTLQNAETLRSAQRAQSGSVFHQLRAEFDAMGPALALVKDQLAGVTDRFAGSLNDVIGFSGAIAKTSLETIKLNTALGQTPPPKPETVTQWRAFLNGLESGFQNVRDKVAGVTGAMSLGREVSEQFSESLSGGLASALVDSIGNLRNFGKAVTQVLSNVAKEIATTITKFLLLRAITGIAGSFMGPSDTTLLTSGAPGLRRGGWANAARGAIHAARGTWVPGPNINRDIIPAVLAPGERVLSRGEVKSMGGVSAVDRMARGGGGGDTYIFNPQISMSGENQNGAQRLMSMMDAWWRDRSRNKPAFREAFA